MTAFRHAPCASALPAFVLPIFALLIVGGSAFAPNAAHAQAAPVTSIENSGGEVVLESYDDGALLAPEAPSGSGAIPAEGTGVRMMWHPGQAAFRAGRVDGSQWNQSNIGIRSVAFGLNTTASGNQSVAMGEGTTASGKRSTAMGYETTASGGSSTAMGNLTTASGTRSTAMGLGATASNFQSRDGLLHDRQRQAVHRDGRQHDRQRGGVHRDGPLDDRHRQPVHGRRPAARRRPRR